MTEAAIERRIGSTRSRDRRPIPTWRPFWEESVPLEVRKNIRAGRLTGREAIVASVVNSGTVIDNITHPLARHLSEEDQQMIARQKGKILIGMGNGYKIVVPNEKTQ